MLGKKERREDQTDLWQKQPSGAAQISEVLVFYGGEVEWDNSHHGGQEEKTGTGRNQGKIQPPRTDPYCITSFN